MPRFFVFLGNERPELADTRHNAAWQVVDEIERINFEQSLARDGFTRETLISSGKSEDEVEKFFKLRPFEKSSEFFETGSSADVKKDYSVKYHVIDGKECIFMKPLAHNPCDTVADAGYGFGDINSSGIAVKEWIQKENTDDGKEGELFPRDLTDGKVAVSDLVVFCDSMSKEKYPKARYVAKGSCLDETHNGLKSIANEIGGGFVVVELPVGKQTEGKSVAEYVVEKFSAAEIATQKEYAAAINANMSHLVAGNYGAFNAGVERSILKMDSLSASSSRSAETLDKAVLQNKEDSLKKIIKDQFDLITNEEQRIDILTKLLVKTFDPKVSFSVTKCVLDQMKDYNLIDGILKRESEVAESSILHSAVNSRAGANKIEIMMDFGFGSLVDVKNKDGITPLEQVLTKTLPKKEALQMFWAMYKYSYDLKNLDSCIEIAKERKDDFVLTKSADLASDMEISRMLPHRLLKEHRAHLVPLHHELPLPPRPQIFTPFYDYKWGRAPAQVLQDFGCDVVRPTYDIAQDHWFKDEASLAALRERVENQVASSNGFIALGNDEYIDPKFFDDSVGKVDLQNYNQRRTYVEMIGFQAAIKMNKPIWTICGGTQMAVVALGGKVGYLEASQNLRGSEGDVMSVAENSQLHLATHSKRDGKDGRESRGDDLLGNAKTWSAHLQGAIIDYNTETGDFNGLPPELRPVAASVDYPNIPKAYQMGDNLLMQSHLEADPSTNPVSRNAIGAFVSRCRADVQSGFVTAIGAEMFLGDDLKATPATNPSSAKIDRLLQERVMLRAAI